MFTLVLQCQYAKIGSIGGNESGMASPEPVKGACCQNKYRLFPGNKGVGFGIDVVEFRALKKIKRINVHVNEFGIIE